MLCYRAGSGILGGLAGPDRYVLGDPAGSDKHVWGYLAGLDNLFLGGPAGSDGHFFGYLAGPDKNFGLPSQLRQVIA